MILLCEKMFILLLQTDVQTLRTPEDASIFLTSLPDSGCIDNWEQFFNVVDEKFVEKPFISFLQKDEGKKKDEIQ